MKAVNIVFMLIFSFMFLACSESSRDELPGKYVNTYEKDAEHYVILKPDSTFFHYYKKKGQEAHVNEGTYKRISKRFAINIIGWDELGECVYYSTENNTGDRHLAMEIYFDTWDQELEFDLNYPDASSKEVNFKKVKR